ncbi:MAG: tRNA CCA-pyrophosphorylase [Deltaproteobacteria bacterium]|nr:tRNA CCA-pyrophosphorylase [Deltaproteobacteria bacterium]
MLDPQLLAFGQKFHGHKCPAMPMGLRTALAAMKALGVEHAPDGQLMALVEIDEDHCATCWADGVQVATGCTFGKGNIRKLNYGKWGLTLIDKKTQRAVRVVPKAEAMMKNKQSEFMKLRSSGIPASQIAAEIADPLVQMVSNAPDEMLLNIGPVQPYAWKDAPHTFDSVVCGECGEMVVERNVRLKDGKAVCKPCSGYEK